MYGIVDIMIACSLDSCVMGHTYIKNGDAVQRVRQGNITN